MSAEVTETIPSPNAWRRFVEYLDWKINPVLLRDLRLYTRGKLALIAYFLTLSGLIMLGVAYALAARYRGEDGRGLLATLAGILAVVCGAIIPNLVYERFRAELANRATELALMSPLSPARLVRGKLVGAWCISLIVLSTAAPLLAVAYLLGGVNLLSILGVVGGIVLAGAVMPTAQLFMATQRQSKGLSRIAAIIVFLGQFIVMLYWTYFLYDSFVGNPYRPEVNAAMLVSFAVAGILIGQFLYIVTVGRLRSEAENRDAAPRVSLAAAAYIGGICCLLVVWYLESVSPSVGGSDLVYGVAGTACFVAYAFCIGFLIVTYSSPMPPRNLREIWRQKPLRSAFLLPGFKSLSIFFIVNAMAILFVPLACLAVDSGYDKAVWRMVCVSLSPFMAITYGMLAYYYIVLPLVKNKRSPNLLPLTIILANIAIGIVSTFVTVLMSVAVTGYDKPELYSLVMGSHPGGLVGAAFESGSVVPGIGSCGVVVMILALLLLLPAAFGNGDRLRGEKPEAFDAP